MDGQIEIRVKVSGNLRKYLDHQTRLQLAEGASIGDLLENLGMPAWEVGVVALNGGLAAITTELQDGDCVELLPPIGGGR
jgi:sulfur carrier protein ThiS